VKIDGKRAYKMARAGKAPELKSKQLVIKEMELLDFAPDQITVRVVCSKGTYIRALARDIGADLGSGAHLTALRRTRVGDARIDQCRSVTDVIEWLKEVEIEIPDKNDDNNNNDDENP
jgi:tRNA pseudouridine55 synthase